MASKRIDKRMRSLWGPPHLSRVGGFGEYIPDLMKQPEPSFL